MKHLPLIFSIVAMAVAVVFGVLSVSGGKETKKDIVKSEADSLGTPVAGGIVYVDLDRIVAEYDMANDLGAVVEAKAKNIQDEVTRRGKSLESEMIAFQEKLNKGLITRSVAEVQGQQLQQKEQEFNEYANTKNNEIIEEQTVMMNQIADAIKTFLDKYNEEKQYSMILTNQRGVPVITADTTLDITDDVILKLNEEYIKNKNKNNK